jgi:hypothetical protein
LFYLSTLSSTKTTWWMDSSVASSHQHRRSMHSSKLRLFVTYDSARGAPCSIERCTREISIKRAIWKLDAQAWTFQMYPTVQSALTAVKRQCKPLPITLIQIPNNWMVRLFGQAKFTNIKYSSSMPSAIGAAGESHITRSVLLATQPFAKCMAASAG